MSCFNKFFCCRDHLLDCNKFFLLLGWCYAISRIYPLGADRRANQITGGLKLHCTSNLLQSKSFHIPESQPTGGFSMGGDINRRDPTIPLQRSGTKERDQTHGVPQLPCMPEEASLSLSHCLAHVPALGLPCSCSHALFKGRGSEGRVLSLTSSLMGSLHSADRREQVATFLRATALRRTPAQ